MVATLEPQLEAHLEDARPFLKWAGGKRRLLDQFQQFFPRSFGEYFEPFLGSGAVFFHLRAAGRVNHASLSDNSNELMVCYRTVRDTPFEVVEHLRSHQATHSKAHYYITRAIDPQTLSLPARAARTIYLNRTCFNGLYRVNRRGQFNVPMGSYKNPTILNEALLYASSAALQDTNLKSVDFAELVASAREGDFIYCDPPYHPLNATSSFTSYTSDAFGEHEQRRLAEVVSQLASRGVLVMVSNSDTPLVREIYGHLRINTVFAARAINCVASKRGPISEIVVTSYELQSGNVAHSTKVLR